VIQLVALASLTFIAVLVAFRASLKPAFVVLVGSTLLIPDTLRLPTTGPFLSVQRLILFAFIANLVVRFIGRELDPDLLRPSKLHVAFFLFLALTFFVGVAFGSTDVAAIDAVFLWTAYVDSFLFFASALVALRAIGDIRWAARTIVAFAALAACIGVVEHFTRHSYGRVLFPRIRELAALPGSGALELRGGSVRVRVASQFALEYAWIATMLLPLAVAVAAHARRIAGLVAPAIIALSVVWTYSRSAYLGFVVGAVLLVVLSRFDGRTTAVASAGAVTVFLILGATGALAGAFRAPDAPASSEVREERLPLVLSEAAERPVTGLGLASLAKRGFIGTDASYLNVYVELGVIGLVALGLLFLGVALPMAFRAVRAPPGVERAIGAASVAGIVVALVGAAAFDMFTLPGAGRTVWLVVAIGVFLGERIPARSSEARMRIGWRAVLPAVGLLCGLAVLATAPVTSTLTFRFRTTDPYTQAHSTGSQGFLGRVLVATACAAIERAGPTATSRAHCFDLRTEAGVGEARLEDPTEAQLRTHANAVILAGYRSVRGFRPVRVDESDRVRTSWARTAPIWCAGIGLLLAVVVPPVPLRRWQEALRS
jgi:hypothetical protein